MKPVIFAENPTKVWTGKWTLTGAVYCMNKSIWEPDLNL